MEQQFTEGTQGWAAGVSHDAPLTCAEIGRLWRSLGFYKILKCVYLHFVSNLQDSHLRQIFDQALAIFDKRIQIATEMLKMEGQPLPEGFGDEDVDTRAPRLFSDLFYYYYTLKMVQINLSLNGQNLAAATRGDVRDFYIESLEANMRYFNSFSELMLQKGVYIRPPYINTLKERDIVHKQDFLRGFLGERRPLLAEEIEYLFLSYRNNAIAAALLTGFKQVARSEPVRDYLARGVSIARKHVEVFTAILEKEDLPVAGDWGEFVTDSTIPPYSDRLMMSHVVILSGVGITNYANAMASSMRHDLSAAFARLIGEAANYSEDGLNIMIENGWFEEPPRHIDRRELVDKVKH